MSVVTKIEYADVTWNPVTGCTLVSEGCDNCYIFPKISWLKSRGLLKYESGTTVAYHKNNITEPCRYLKPKRIYICSMGDLFHENVPVKFIQAVFEIVRYCKQHFFMVCTKRAYRLSQLAHAISWPNNLWVGVSIESPQYMSRMMELHFLPTNNIFVAFEPLIEPIQHVDLTGINWVIVGGESGPGARALDLDTVRMLRDEAKTKDIPFFFKQWDSSKKREFGRTLDGQIWNQKPSL
jgi:protein gp37